MTTPSHEEMIKHLRTTIAVAARGKSMGHQPFGSTLVSPEGEILLQQCNFGPVFHAESELARVAATNFTSEYLSKCVLYTSVEPCAMCSGTCYWAHVGTIVFGLSSQKLNELTAHTDNPTLQLSTRDVINKGSRDIKVYGPFPELEEEIAKDHREFWGTP